MTTPPKARRFHLDRSESMSGAAEGQQTPPNAAAPGIRVEVHRKTDQPPRFAHPLSGAADSAAGDSGARDRMMQTEQVEDGFGDMRFPGAEAKPPQSDAPAQVTGDELEAKLSAIRAEKLTERQLRIARRIATMHQISVSSDEEAVLRLRERGIDPSHRAAVGRILSTEGSKAQAAPAANTPVPLPRILVPAPAPAAPTPKPTLPSREEMTEERRAAEIHRIQQEIAARRRRRMVMLVARLMVFVFLPTAVMGWYYFRVATPLYATYTQFLIQQAEGGGGSGLGGLFSGTQLAMNNDSVAVQSYLTSRDAMLRLDQDMGFRRTYQDTAIDPVKRLAPDATNEATYRVYKDSVKIGYDPTEGVIKMEVIAPDPQLSQDFSLALIGYAEGQVDQLTARLRDDQMRGSIENYQDAEAKVLLAQQRVQELQQRLGVLDPQAEGSVVMGRVANLEGQLAQRELELGQILANPRPQQSRVETIRGDIARLQAMIGETRLQLTQGSEQRASLASISGELRIAESDLSTRQALLATAAEQVEIARVEANKQVRYLSVVVEPVPPDEATYPKAVQNTFVAMLIFAGIYLMLSLTASILREQVSS
ncbi:MAG: capsule biosynthesis protein [Paracoccus sp. (in: a-proteobacteria)]|uniref:capsule biosynthesis protein n=1 Tax=Paracoccus sp. TaxID=267 RepID=UPI0026DF45F5|nr:capsule biosynthesis protein [Paracoccus sp. (in: a-proteobacteria)]MDO5632271.1 capsule biosynthesis protein [Paracoccus sp. (in: a-proteobacteria)]